MGLRMIEPKSSTFTTAWRSSSFIAQVWALDRDPTRYTTLTTYNVETTKSIQVSTEECDKLAFSFSRNTTGDSTTVDFH